VTPIFLALATVSIFVAPYLIAGGVNRPQTPQLRQDVRTLERAEGINVPVDVEQVSKVTKEANAFAVGLGPTERIVLWDTFLRKPFTRNEVRVVLAHEFGHIAHRHLWKGMGWTVLFAFPIAFALAQITRRRGGLGDPGVLPYGVLVLVLLNLVLTPITSVVSRRYEADADWSALKAAKDPASQESLFKKFSKTSLQQPDPPAWSYVFFETHPTLMQRIAMAEAWKKKR
jgi:STE24 endopeptidase